MNKILVSDIMTRQPLTVKPETTLLDCAKKLVRKRTESLILAEDKKLRGFISTQDILWAVIKKNKKDLAKIKASDISPRKIVTIKPEANIEEAVTKMRKYKFHRLPVLKNGEIVGLVSLRDILGYYPDLDPQFKELEMIQEETEKLERRDDEKENSVVSDGICEECGARGPLYRMHGMLICSSCMDSS